MICIGLHLLSLVSRSREGAWIEIAVDMPNFDAEEVAPVRERGLKSAFWEKILNIFWSLP